MEYRKIIINGIELTKNISYLKREFSCLIFGIKRKELENVQKNILYPKGFENFLEIQFYNKKNNILEYSYSQCFSFYTDSLSITKAESFNYKNTDFIELSVPYKTHSKEELLRDLNYEFQNSIKRIDELEKNKTIHEVEVGLPPRIPIGESSSKEDVKQKKDFMDIFFHIALISSWFVLLAKCLLGVWMIWRY